MMRKLYDLAVKTREYTDNNGNNRANWENIGSIMENDKGTRFMFVKKTFNPAGVPIVGNARADSDSILVSMFEPKDNNNRGNGGNGNRGGNYGNGNGNGGGFYNNGNQRQQGQQRQQRRDDDYPMDFASFEESGFDFQNGPAGGGNDADVPF